MKSKLKKLLFWLCGVSMEQSRQERTYGICFMSMYYVSMIMLCVLGDWSRKNNKEVPLTPSIILLFVMLLFGLAYRRAGNKRLKAEAKNI